MIIKCWGSRGSIPVSGKEYVKYGGETTCLELRTKNDDIIIVDAGTGIRRLGKQLLKENRLNVHMLFTHAHWDHVIGFPFFNPIYRKQAELNIYRCPFKDQFVEKMIEQVLSPPYFPLKYADLNAPIIYRDACPEAFDIGTLHVAPISLNHPNGGNGYKFIEDGKEFVFLTDNELGYLHPNGLCAEDYLDFVRDADVLFHDAEYTPEEYESFIEFGHSAYTDVIDLAVKAGVRKLGLFHLNRDRTDEQVDQMVATCRKMISDRGARMDCFAVGTDMVLEL